MAEERSAHAATKAVEPFMTAGDVGVVGCKLWWFQGNEQWKQMQTKTREPRKSAEAAQRRRCVIR